MADTAGTVYTGYVQDGRFWFSWSLSSQSIANNTSTINWSCGVSSAHYYYSNAVKMSAISFAGTQVYDGGTYSNIYNETRTLGSGTIAVNHNGDGTCTISVSAFTGYLFSHMSGSTPIYDSASCSGGSWSLPTIPRKSDLSISKNNVYADNSDTITATITKKASAFTDKLELTMGSKSKEFTISNGTAAIKIPENWASEFPNAVSKTGTLTLTTYNGNAVIGSTTKELIVMVKNYSPSLSITSIAPVGTPSVFSSVNYVQSLSKVRVRSSASGYQGSTITSQKVSILNKAYDGSDITSDFLGLSGTIQILVTCVDSRGKTNAITQTISAVEYYPPTVSIEVSSSQAEEKNTINVSTRISSVNGLNAKTYKLLGTWIDEDGTVHTDEQLASGTITNPDFTLYHNSIDLTITYTYKVRIEDSVGYDVAEGITGVIAISRYAGGKGLRLFGEANQNGFDMNSKLSDIYALTNTAVMKSLLDLFHPVGDIVYNENPDFDPNNEWGGSWEIIRGRYIVAPSLATLANSKWRLKDNIPEDVFTDTGLAMPMKVKLPSEPDYTYDWLRIEKPSSNTYWIRTKNDMDDWYHFLYRKDSQGTYYDERNRTFTVVSATMNVPRMIEILETIADLVEGTMNYELGERVIEGLPNITGVGHYGDNNNEFSGALYNVKNANYIGDGSASGTLIGFDASKSNAIYGRSDTVTPRSYVANIWRRIA